MSKAGIVYLFIILNVNLMQMLSLNIPRAQLKVILVLTRAYSYFKKRCQKRLQGKIGIFETS